MEACLTALFLTDPRDDRNRLIHVKGLRVDGTCEWIKTNELYDLWLHSRSQLLWLSGGPGKGKTMLSIFLAGELERMANNSHDVLFMQYFCDNKDEKRNTATAIIRGLIFQLLLLRPKLFDYILPSFKIQKESLFTSSSFEALWRIFENMCHDPVLGNTYCVIDGLDECDEASLELLLKKFKAFFSKKLDEFSACRLKLIAVSRSLPDFIPELLSSFPCIRLDPDADREVNSDICRFIDVKVDELSACGNYPGPLRLHVKHIFLNRAEGTFLWVGIVASELRKYKLSEIGNALELFPSGLEGLYAHMLLQISDHRRETAAKILRWVVMAIRPLTLSELSAAIETTVIPSVGLSCDEVIRDQLAFCGYFLTIKGDEVGLIHQSAKDYLLRKTPDSNPKLEFFRIEEEKTNLEIAQKCLAYLQNGALADGAVFLEDKYDLVKDTSRLKAFPLLSYATLHWPEHARSLASSEDIFDLSSPFFKEKSLVREYWLQTYFTTKRWNALSNSASLLHIASHFNIVPIVKNLLSKKGRMNRLKLYIDVNRRGSSRRRALHWAARSGHEAVVRLLLEKGARVDAKDGLGSTALHLAARSGHEAVVRLLLEKGARVDAKAEDGSTALHQAARSGHEAVVRLLLEKGARVDAKDGLGSTALHRAAESGHEAVARLLLEKGARVDAKAEDASTALHWAAHSGHEVVVRLLLEKGARVDEKDEDGSTALHLAARSRHEVLVRLLLEKGARVDEKDEDGSTALHRAAESGHEAVVRLLLEKGARVDAKAEDRSTALHQAARSGHEAVVRLLLKKGARQEGGEGRREGRGRVDGATLGGPL